MNRVEKSEELFLKGYNCSQAVIGAFCDKIDLSFDDAMKISLGFGGGMGRMREVCGACSGAFMVIGMLYGKSAPTTTEERKELYARIRAIAEEFRIDNGSIICNDLLGGNAEVGGTPSERTKEYYKKRPCVECVKSAVRILEEYIEKN